MRIFLLFSCLVVSFPAFTQEKTVSKHTIIYGHIDYITTEHLNSPRFYPMRQTYGLLIGASRDVMVTKNFHLDIKLGYRFVSKYAHPDAYSSVYEKPGSENILYNYYGISTGVGFNLGRQHLWENSLIIGGGIMKKPGYSLSAGQMEMGIQTGYKYVGQKGLVIRAGLSSNFARNGFFSQMYSVYGGFGYAFLKPQEIDDSPKQKKDKGYFNINLSAYLGSITLDFIGLNLRADHFLYNGPHADLGYGISGRIAYNVDLDASYSASASLIGLFGKGDTKFEFSLGPNFPFAEIQNDFLTWYEAVHIGIGIRYMPKEYPITVRLGSSTTTILHFGIGVQF